MMLLFFDFAVLYISLCLSSSFLFGEDGRQRDCESRKQIGAGGVLLFVDPELYVILVKAVGLNVFVFRGNDPVFQRPRLAVQPIKPYPPWQKYGNPAGILQ
jgi:hypothetical protein